MNIRSILSDDISLLAEYWYDTVALQSQKQSIIRLMPDAIAQWQAYVTEQLKLSNTVAYVAQFEADIIGCMITQITDNQAGLLPKQYGLVTDLVLDLHSPHKRRNAVNALLNKTTATLREKNITNLMVRATTYSPIEQGFWRGLGLAHLEDTFWMDL